ncbi:MAG TPA: zf-HC2 domain-containing protein [Candidatus Binataceae bacterium]|nr:zf-HC2 domain-containing protein [Candidatus Binataceae bacterium]
MNCFEARHDFPAFWRRELSADRRAALNAHLDRCAKCGQAFRVFALTAPVLHCESAAVSGAAAPREFTFEPRARASAPRINASYGARRRWLAMCASALIFLAASTGAYFAASAPAQSLSEALTNPQDQSGQPLFGPELPDSSDDLAG